MKVNIIKSICFCMVLINTIHSQQLECDYVPLEYESINSQWRHLTIDTSWMGLITPNSTFDSTYQDGMWHIQGDREILIESDQTLISIAYIFEDLDTRGYVVEAINIATGELLWFNKSDMFTDSVDHKVLEAEIINDRLVVHGVVPAVEDDYWDSLSMGWIDSYYYRKVYDLNTGELLESYYADRETSQVLTTKITEDYMFFEDDRIYWIKQDISINGSYLIKNVMNDSAELISKDTIKKLTYSDVLSENAATGATWTFKLTRNDQEYLYLEQFVPRNDSDLKHAAKLTLYDDDFNELKSVQLEDLVHDSFHSVRIEEFSDDRIIVRGDLDAIWGEYFFYIFDRNLELVESIDCIYNNEYTYISVTHLIDDSNVLHYWQRDYDEGKSMLHYYRSNTEGTLDRISSIEVAEPNWLSSVRHMEILDDGDVVLRFVHGCMKEENVIGSRHLEWWRVSGDELGITVNTEEPEVLDLNAYPNPTTGIVYLEMDDIESVSVYNTIGELVKHSTSSVNVVDLREQPSGMFWVTIAGWDGKLLTYKLIKI